MFESDDYSYANLCMIIDSLLSERLFSSYNADNYDTISSEINARSAQLFETLKFIDEFCPEMKESFKEQFSYNMTDTRVRKESFGSLSYYTTCMHIFLIEEEIRGETRKEYIENPDLTDMEKERYFEEIAKYKRLFSKFPVLEYDETEYRFKLKSEEELIKLKEKYEKENDAVGLDLVNNVLYDNRIEQFLGERDFIDIDDAVTQVREGLGGK